MATAIDICNDALSHLGVDTQVSDIAPPDGSVEAGRCARWYPRARTELLEMTAPSFALYRRELTEVANTSDNWAYAYQKPSDCLRPLRILSIQAANATGNLTLVDGTTEQDRDSAPFQVEGDVVFTDEPEAVLLYVRDVTDTAKFTPMFVSAMGYLLASKLAGPTIRGDEGASAALKWRQMAMDVGNQAAVLNANGGGEAQTAHHKPTWIRGR